MKTRHFSVFMMLFMFSISAIAQQLKQEDLPPGLVYEFKNRYPGVDDVKWSLHNDIYFADFVFMENAVLAKYELSTTWLSAETFYEKENLPRTMLRYIAANFTSHQIEKARFMESKGELPYFEVETSEDGQKRFLFFDKEGIFLRMTDDHGNEVFSGAISSEPGMQVISPKELPTPANSHILLNYSAFRIAQSYLINNEKWQNTYYIVLTSHLEKDKVELWFDFRGNLVDKNDPGELRRIAQSDQEDAKSGKKKGKEKPQTLSEDLVPAAVKTSFNKQVKKYEKLTWDTIKGNYIASYYNPSRRETSKSEFTKDGKWVQTSTELNTKNLNQNIVRHLDQNYPDLRIHSAESLKDAQRKRYVLVRIFDSKWVNDPMVYHELYFNPSGRLEKEIYANYKEDIGVTTDDINRRERERFLENVDQDDLTFSDDYKQISSKELPTRAVKHIKNTYPEYRITESFIMKDDVTEQTVYWVVLRKEGLRTRTKASYDIRGNFIEAEEF
jgi:hypothetical protein